MNTNCLAKKIKGTVDGSNLIKITDFIFGLGVATTPNEYQCIRVKCEGTLTVTGDAYFTNINGDNLGKTAQGTTSTVTTYYIYSPSNGNKLVFNSVNIIELNLNYYPVASISHIGRLNNLLSINSANFYYKVDIAQFSIRNIRSLFVMGLEGNIENLIGANYLEAIQTYDRGDNLYGDAVKVADNILAVNTRASLGYSTRDTTKKMVLINGGANLGDRVDSYLINSAACLDHSYPYKTININGSARTSASDSAVATLKARGCTIRVNGELL